MYKNIKVEAENLELIIENSHGDKAIIPANKRDWVKQKLSEGCHSCIDSLVETLPIASQYAQDGSVYPSVRTTKFDDTTENKYQQWRASLPKNLQYEGDYDLRGFYKENPDFNINDSEQHLTDKWKLPNHPTFSDESVYYKGNENYGGKWKSYDYGDVYTPNNPEVKQQKLEWKKGFYSKDKVVVDGKLYDINTPEYKEIYDKGIGYFDKTGTFISSKEDLPEVTVSSKIQPNTVSSYISEFAKQTPKEEYLQNKSREHNKKFYSAPLWAQQVVGGYNEERKKSDRKRDEEDYNKLQSNFITEKLLNRNKQKDNETRVQWLQRFSDKELEVIKNSDYKSKIEPSIWSKFEQGLLSIGNAGSPVTFKNENLTQEEAKKEDNPLNILQPLSIPSKMVQSSYKDGYSFTDALKGKNNNAGIVEDIVTDPLNLVGVGLAGKLSKADKIIDATKAGSKILSKKEGLNKIDNILQESNQLPEPPHEIILDQPSNYLETINLERQGVKNKKIMPSFDDVDLGNDLILRNNPSRVINKEDILGKHHALVSVKNKKTNEYIDLKSWKDIDGKIYYYMSASMPSSKIKAGRAYMELEKHIPKGESLLENTSLSYDSFLNILKQTKNPKFETFVKGRIPMNDMAVSNKLKSIGNRTSDSIELGFYNKEIVDNAVNELNMLIDKYNLPKATVIKRTVSTQPAAHLPYEKKDIFEIELPNIGLKKLYSIIGLTSAGAAIQSQNQNQNKSEQ